MRDSASILAKTTAAEVLFHWEEFDGDDCFGKFHIEVVIGSVTERFEFGHSIVWVLRKSARVFRGKADNVESTFKFPDTRTCNLKRIEDGFLLEICLEGTNRCEEYRLIKPTLFFDDEFLYRYNPDLI